MHLLFLLWYFCSPAHSMRCTRYEYALRRMLKEEAWSCQPHLLSGEPGLGGKDGLSSTRWGFSRQRSDPVQHNILWAPVDGGGVAGHGI